MRGREVLLELSSQALLGVERGLRPAVLELGGLARRALLLSPAATEPPRRLD